MKTPHPKITSAASMHRIASHANTPITPPATVPLSAEDLPFFSNIIEEFARAEWSPHQLEVAALLAMSMADLSREQRLLRSEDSVVIGGLGGPIINPRKSAVQMHAANVIAYRRSLSLHHAARGTPTDQAKRIAIGKQIESDARETDDDLLARPN